MGTNKFTGLKFDLNSFFSDSVDPSSLVEIFSKTEIGAIVEALPSDNGPGPDGFNTDFIKKWWPIICEDFYRLCEAFYSERVCLHGINGSYITLIPKKNDALRVSDYKPNDLLTEYFGQDFNEGIGQRT